MFLPLFQKPCHNPNCMVLIITYRNERVYRSMLAYSGEEATVFEPFGGSGTTLIAAEKAGRRAFLMEQHPAYCDIIVKRWEAFTGKSANRVSIGAAVP